MCVCVSVSTHTGCIHIVCVCVCVGGFAYARVFVYILVCVNVCSPLLNWQPNFQRTISLSTSGLCDCKVARVGRPARDYRRCRYFHAA